MEEGQILKGKNPGEPAVFQVGPGLNSLVA